MARSPAEALSLSLPPPSRPFTRSTGGRGGPSGRDGPTGPRSPWDSPSPAEPTGPTGSDSPRPPLITPVSRPLSAAPPAPPGARGWATGSTWLKGNSGTSRIEKLLTSPSASTSLTSSSVSGRPLSCASPGPLKRLEDDKTAALVAGVFCLSLRRCFAALSPSAGSKWSSLGMPEHAEPGLDTCPERVRRDGGAAGRPSATTLPA